MLFFSNLFDKYNLLTIILRIPIVLFSLSFHEASHALIAHKLGDDTAKNLGRITLNPFKHLDIIGTVCLVIFGVGWANPVPIMTRNFKNPKKGMVLSAEAGPLSNIILSLAGFILFTVVASLCGYSHISVIAVEQATGFSNIFLYVICEFLYLFHFVNLVYAIFNLIPVPPLDGSRLFLSFLPDKIYFGIMKYERIIMLVFLGIMVLAGFNFISDICSYISGGLFKLVALISGNPDAEYMPGIVYSLIKYRLEG